MSDVAHYAVRDGIAVISMNNPPINGLSNAARSDHGRPEKADKDAAVKAVVLIGAAKAFSAAPTSASSTARASSPTFRTSTTGRAR
jgi:3-hydroxyacyl-CoA dehydrogenase